MAIWIEPTDYLNRQLAMLDDSEATRVWRELETLNRRLNHLLKPPPPSRVACLTTPALQREQLAIAVVCSKNGVSTSMLRTTLKNQDITLARHQLTALLTHELHYPHKRTAVLLRRDRTTVNHSLKVHDDQMVTNPEYRQRYNMIRQAFHTQQAAASTQQRPHSVQPQAARLAQAR